MLPCIQKRFHFTFPIPKKLNEVARVPLLKQESPIKIRQLWQEQFKSRPDVVVGTMAKAEYDLFRANTSMWPVFIVPVMKNESSYFNLVSQFQDGKHCLVTSLEAFRQDPRNASPMMVATIYDELISEKGLALMRADIISRLDISREDAHKVMKCLRHIYISKPGLVKTFNIDPRNFDYEDFMKYCMQYSNEGGGVSNSI